MTREERHIAVLSRLLENMDVYDSVQPTEERKKAIKAAIKALSQEPCEDAISIRKDALKTRVGNIVAYNVEWLKDHWQMEMDIVCGVKPCTDAVSRQAVLSKKIYTETEEGWSGYTVDADYIEQLPSVTPTCEEREKGECPWYAG